MAKFTGGKPRKAVQPNPVHEYRKRNLDLFLVSGEMRRIDLARRMWGQDSDGSFLGQMRRGEKLISEDNAYLIEQAIGYKPGRPKGWLSQPPGGPFGATPPERVLSAGPLKAEPADSVVVKTKAEAWAAATTALLRLAEDAGLEVPEDKYEKLAEAVVRRALRTGVVNVDDVADMLALMT